ncbi:MAG TPA: DUF3375 family protein [Gemmatimonadaceae bacterium]|nr:DUF3375 family protein [Gemmatimonadaceae bacterium]
MVGAPGSWYNPWALRSRRPRRDHPAWRLLGAQHAPLIVSVLHRYFVEPNVRTMPRDELVARVEDDLFHLREELGDDAFPRPAADYLDEWASDDKGWLRKYYPNQRRGGRE